MTTTSVTVVACSILLWAGTTLGAPTAEQNCQKARAQAWGKYHRCIQTVVAKLYGASVFDHFKAFWKCRHKSFDNWTKFQTQSKLQGSSCINSRFTNNGDGTVTDNLSGLVWETKTDDDTVHDKDNSYTWSPAPPYAENGTAFSDFLGTVNGSGFAGANGWRMPTLAELQSIMQDFSCTGSGGGPACVCTAPCVAFSDSNTYPNAYWSSTSHPESPNVAWVLDFSSAGGGVYAFFKYTNFYMRAVRGGL